MSEHYILVKPELCTGCKSCELACAVEHSKTKSIYTAPFEDPKPMPRITVLPVDGLTVPTRCVHCAQPPCMDACPFDAINISPEGFVLIDEGKCKGCMVCARACPFGAITLYRPKRIAVKCDFCYERVRAGKEPACVEACPTGALRYGRLDDLMKEVAQAKIRELLKAFSSEARAIIVPPPYGKGSSGAPVTPPIIRQSFAREG
ncbi:4Fe-4S dicluster domain-containing protein [Infirmifilum sp.]|uniref:4Fe-4S dicluster domain-containing protein n=1 Tax=Infirmifilum sp. TaxID=2856575 RepID=UPI003D0CB0CD